MWYPLLRTCQFFSRLPFNWKTPLGYSMTLSAQSAASFSTLFVSVPLLCFFVGCCVILVSFCEDITNELSMLNLFQNKNKRNNRPIAKLKVELKKRLCAIFQIYLDTEKLSEFSQLPYSHKNDQLFASFCRLIVDFNQIHEYTITLLFLWSLGCICSTLLIFQTLLVEYGADFLISIHCNLLLLLLFLYTHKFHSRIHLGLCWFSHQCSFYGHSYCLEHFANMARWSKINMINFMVSCANSIGICYRLSHANV